MRADDDSDPERWNSWESPQDVHEVTQLWCLYHLQDPLRAIGEAGRVLRAGGTTHPLRHATVTPPERAEEAEVPLWLTKRGVLVWARKR